MPEWVPVLRTTCLIFRCHACSECPGNLVNHGMEQTLTGLFQYAMLGKSLMVALCPRPSEAGPGVICTKSSDSSDKVSCFFSGIFSQFVYQVYHISSANFCISIYSISIDFTSAASKTHWFVVNIGAFLTRPPFPDLIGIAVNSSHPGF